MATKLTFEDVLVRCHGANEQINLILLLTQKLRGTRVLATTIIWEPHEKEKSHYSFHNNSRVQKNKSNGWRNPLHSQQLTDTISYFQLKIIENTKVEEGDGIMFGVCSADRTMDSFKYSMPEICNCIYNNRDSLSLAGVRVLKPCSAVVGDVIGIVVDTVTDETRFYINTQLVAIGKSKVSQFQPLYAVLWIYYQSCVIEMGDYYPYISLKN
jgi:hypothetical protein